MGNPTLLSQTEIAVSLFADAACDSPPGVRGLNHTRGAERIHVENQYCWLHLQNTTGYSKHSNHWCIDDFPASAAGRLVNYSRGGGDF